MAAESSSRETGKDQVESVIDDLIRDILSESGATSESGTRGMATTAVLFEQAFGSIRGASRTATLERLIVAEAFASELADSLSSALAERLTPRLVKALEQIMAEEAAARKPPSSARSGGQGKKG